jgi:hypothetical protein
MLSSAYRTLWPVTEEVGATHGTTPQTWELHTGCPGLLLVARNTLVSPTCSASLPLFLLLLVNTSLAGFATLDPPSYRCSSASLVLSRQSDARPSVQ